jgi:hypothetical protein
MLTVSLLADGSTAAGSSSSALAVAAFVVSIISAVMVLGTLVWQLRLYSLSGARLKVSLVFGYLGVDGNTLRYPGVRASRTPPSWSSNFVGHASDFGIEYAEVRVTNIGRAAVSGEDICFDLGRCSWWSVMIAHQVRDTYHQKIQVAPMLRWRDRFDKWATAKVAEWRRIETGEQQDWL